MSSERTLLMRVSREARADNPSADDVDSAINHDQTYTWWVIEA